MARSMEKQWWIILISGLVASGFLLNAWFTPPTYPAKTIFMVNEDEGSSTSGISSLLGQFGLGGGGKSGKFNLDKIIELSKSLKILQAALFKEIEINGKKDFYANHIIHYYEFHDKWKKDTTGLVGFYFTHNKFDDFTRVENSALKQVYEQVRGGENTEALLTTSYDDKTGILSMSINSVREELSIGLMNEIYEELSNFYINKSVESKRRTYESIKFKVDSLRARYQQLNLSLARVEDQSYSVLDKTNLVKINDLRTESQVTMLAYGEAMKNMEFSDFQLRTATPIFQVIDSALPPIKPEKSSKVRAILIGGFLGGFLALGFFIGRKIIRDAMASSK
ncbi:MAG: hypothetical protein HC912_10520 [Saprospiraceae bacterium]|nr:hypothetical protein [Saprospiraceae bacterium]